MRAADLSHYPVNISSDAQVSRAGELTLGGHYPVYYILQQALLDLGKDPVSSGHGILSFFAALSGTSSGVEGFRYSGRPAQECALAEKLMGKLHLLQGKAPVNDGTDAPLGHQGHSLL